jgi:hypothetical protein
MPLCTAPLASCFGPSSSGGRFLFHLRAVVVFLPNCPRCFPSSEHQGRKPPTPRLRTQQTASLGCPPRHVHGPLRGPACQLQDAAASTPSSGPTDQHGDGLGAASSISHRLLPLCFFRPVAVALRWLLDDKPLPSDALA